MDNTHSDKDIVKIFAVVVLFVALAVVLARCATSEASAATCTPLPTCTAALTTNCATPTPVASWDASTALDIAGHSLYYREPGGTWQKLLDFPCEWYDLDADSVMDIRFCRGPDLGVPLQRYCATCATGTAYEFAVRAYDLTGNVSGYSAALPVCFSPVCVRPGPCS